MDLVDVRAHERGPVLPAWREGDAWLAGGTYLFSEPQPRVRRLLDLTDLGWAPVEVDDEGLRLAATCTVAELAALADDPPPDWTVGPLLRAACEAFLAPLTVWGTATVGGNLCTALPAGPMTTLLAALEGSAELHAPDGAVRSMPVRDLVTGNGTTALRPGELLRAVRVAPAPLRSRTAWRRASLTEHGRSSVFLVGRVDPGSTTVVLTVTAATTRPVRVRLDPDDDVRDAVATGCAPAWHVDVYGSAAWRRHLVLEFAEQIAAEMRAPDGAR